MREALAHDSVPSPLKPYPENQHPYHPFTGTGCTGLSNDNDSVLEDHRAQPAVDPSSSACNSQHQTEMTFWKTLALSYKIFVQEVKLHMFSERPRH